MRSLSLSHIIKYIDCMTHSYFWCIDPDLHKSLPYSSPMFTQNHSKTPLPARLQ